MLRTRHHQRIRRFQRVRFPIDLPSFQFSIFFTALSLWAMDDVSCANHPPHIPETPSPPPEPEEALPEVDEEIMKTLTPEVSNPVLLV